MKRRILPGCLLLALAAGACAQVAVVSSASFRPNQPVAAGSLASAYGAFTGVAPAAAAATPLPKLLGGVRVLVNNIECPLYYVSDAQVNFQVPGSLRPGAYEIRVTAGSMERLGILVVMSAAPGLFTFYSSGEPPRGAVLNQDGLTVNSAQSPEARGRLVSLFATGAGRLTQAVADGEPAPVSPLIRTLSEPVVYVSGVQAQVEFSGLTPTAVGLWQINVRIPEHPFIRGRVPVQVFMDGVDSNEVSIFVAP